MKVIRDWILHLTAGLGLVAALPAQVIIGTGGITTQTFDSMGATQAATLPSGWKVSSAGGGNTATWSGGGTATTQQASLGSPTAGGIYNWGATGGTERALGFMTSSGYASPNAVMVQMQNNTGGTITALNSIDFDIERYRINTAAASIAFSYSTDGSTWTAASSGDIASSTIGTGASAYNFSTPTVFSPNAFNISGLSLTNSSFIYFKWVFNTTGSNSQGLGLDNFSMGAPTYTVSGADVSYGGGGSFSSSSFGGAAFTSADTAVFGGASGTTVNLSGSVAASALKFTTGGYTLASPTGSDSVTLTSGAIDVATSVDATISGKISGSNGVTKTGSGNLTLSGSNDFTGAVTVSAGNLSISSDANLGNTANDVAVSGTLTTTASISLNSGRDISGSGTLAIANGTTLTSNGTFNMGAVTLSDSGTLALSGASNTMTSLTFNAAGSVSGNSLSLAGNVTTTGYSGTATVSNAIALGNAARTYTIDTNAALTLSGNLSSTSSGRLQKRGAGTLTLSGDNAGLVGVQIGAQGTTPSEGGAVVVATNTALGSGQLQFNSGTLSSSSARTFTNGISIGGRSGSGVSVPTITGSDMEFQGANGIFKATGTSGTINLNINNNTTLSGNFAATSGSGTLTSVTLGGSGTLTLKGTNSALADAITVGDTLTVHVNSATDGLGSGAVTINSGGTLKITASTVANNLSIAGRLSGTGTVSGVVDILNGGHVSPGTSPGILTNSGTLTFASGSAYDWELNAYSTSNAGTDFDEILTSGSVVINAGAILAPSFIGTAASPVTNASYWASAQTWRVIATSGSGSVTGTFAIDNSSWSSIGAFSTAASAGGLDLLWTPVSAVPEPATYATILGSIAFLGFILARRRSVRF